MSPVQEIESAIGRLSPRELDELQAWMEEQYPLPVDVQLKADPEAGRMDERIRRALAVHAAGSVRAL